jgi:hypothetical protein
MCRVSCCCVLSSRVACRCVRRRVSVRGTVSWVVSGRVLTCSPTLARSRLTLALALALSRRPPHHGTPGRVSCVIRLARPRPRSLSPAAPPRYPRPCVVCYTSRSPSPTLSLAGRSTKVPHSCSCQCSHARFVVSASCRGVRPHVLQRREPVLTPLALALAPPTLPAFPPRYPSLLTALVRAHARSLLLSRVVVVVSCRVSVRAAMGVGGSLVLLSCGGCHVSCVVCNPMVLAPHQGSPRSSVLTLMSLSMCTRSLCRVGGVSGRAARVLWA